MSKLCYEVPEKKKTPFKATPTTASEVGKASRPKLVLSRSQSSTEN